MEVLYSLRFLPSHVPSQDAENILSRRGFPVRVMNEYDDRASLLMTHEVPWVEHDLNQMGYYIEEIKSDKTCP